MNSPDSTQRREHQRVVVKWPVTMMTPEGDMDGTIENISAGGAYIRCGTPLFTRDLFILSILSHNGEDTWIGAEVVWIDIPPDHNSEVAVGMGVRFTNISPEVLKFIDAAVSQYS
jgi:c-di-GMP-binding flagellar brake protein YcgR